VVAVLVASEFPSGDDELVLFLASLAVLDELEKPRSFQASDSFADSVPL
jgi:hypothetical protein